MRLFPRIDPSISILSSPKWEMAKKSKVKVILLSKIWQVRMATFLATLRVRWWEPNQIALGHHFYAERGTSRFQKSRICSTRVIVEAIQFILVFSPKPTPNNLLLIKVWQLIITLIPKKKQGSTTACKVLMSKILRCRSIKPSTIWKSPSFPTSMKSIAVLRQCTPATTSQTTVGEVAITMIIMP